MSYTGNDHDNRLLSLDAAEAELAEIVGFKIDIPTAERNGLRVHRLGQFRRVRRCDLRQWGEAKKVKGLF